MQLNKWAEFVREADPDIITGACAAPLVGAVRGATTDRVSNSHCPGYNVQNFDIPYILNRAKALKCEPAQVRPRARQVFGHMGLTTSFVPSGYSY